jgi:hypothetical protein
VRFLKLFSKLLDRLLETVSATKEIKFDADEFLSNDPEKEKSVTEQLRQLEPIVSESANPIAQNAYERLQSFRRLVLNKAALCDSEDFEEAGDELERFLSNDRFGLMCYFAAVDKDLLGSSLLRDRLELSCRGTTHVFFSENYYRRNRKWKIRPIPCRPTPQTCVRRFV